MSHTQAELADSWSRNSILRLSGWKGICKVFFFNIHVSDHQGVHALKRRVDSSFLSDTDFVDSQDWVCQHWITTNKQNFLFSLRWSSLHWFMLFTEACDRLRKGIFIENLIMWLATFADLSSPLLGLHCSSKLTEKLTDAAAMFFFRKPFNKTSLMSGWYGGKCYSFRSKDSFSSR